MTPWRRSTTLRARILKVTAAAAFVTLLGALALYAFALDRVLYDITDRAARDQAEQVTSLVLEQDVPPSVALDHVATRGSVVQLLDDAGHVVAHTDPAAASGPLSALRPAPGQVLTEQTIGLPSDPDAPYAVVAVGFDRPTDDGSSMLLLASPLQTETALVRQATIALGVLAVLALVGLLWLIDRVLRRALGDVERIRRTVADIRTANSRAPIPVPPGDDEISRLAVTMNDMLERLHRADAAQHAFVSNASHELRSPLTTIRMIAETSPRGIDADSTGIVAGEALRMQHLVQDLLTLAQADDQGLVRDAVEVDIDELALDEVRRIRAASALTATGDIRAARVVGDAGRLTQALRNLVDNAMRHAGTTVRIDTHVEGADVVVHVDNDGEVIRPEDREAVFDRFARLQESRDRDSGGSGLGLAIVRAIVDAHGGTVVADESADGWCRFTVTLPAVVGEEDGSDDA